MSEKDPMLDLKNAVASLQVLADKMHGDERYGEANLIRLLARQVDEAAEEFEEVVCELRREKAPS